MTARYVDILDRVTLDHVTQQRSMLVSRHCFLTCPSDFRIEALP